MNTRSLLALSAFLTLAGCGSSSSTSNSEPEASSGDETTTTTETTSSEPSLPEEGCPRDMPSSGSACTIPAQSCHYTYTTGNEHSGPVSTTLGCTCNDAGTWTCDNAPMI